MGSTRVAEPDPADGLTRDDFLGGRLRICQPAQGYRAGIDPVLLAASVPARPGEQVLELGCGAGVALFCLGRRVPELSLTGVELQAGYADLARENARQNDIRAEIVTADLTRLPQDVIQRQFSHVFCNPPYFDRHASTPAQDPGREAALGVVAPLQDWVSVAAKRTAPKGSVTFIHRIEHLPELLGAAGTVLGSLEILPLLPRAGKAARLFILRGRKGGRAAFRLHPGWILHEGTAHAGDRDSYTPQTAAILRRGAALPLDGQETLL